VSRSVRCGTPYEDQQKGGWAITYRDGHIVWVVRFKTLAAANDAYGTLRQPHRTGLYTVRWDRQYARCDCGWKTGKLRKAEWSAFGLAHMDEAMIEEQQAALRLVSA
jgi:hypothetical protein